MGKHYQKRIFTSLCAATGLLAMSLPTAVGAQQEEDDSGSRYAIEEVIITARKIAEGLQDAPLAITAISGKELENRGAIDVTDVAAAAPNVHFQTGGAVSGLTAAPTVFIRGIGQGDFNINNDPAVGMYLDGVYLGRMIGSLADLMELERAEVLRGPQGTLFGRNSIGGAINLISRKPDSESMHGSALLSLGERDLQFLKGSVNIPIADNASALLTALYRQRTGYVEAAQYDDLQLGGEEVTGLRGALRVQPTDRITLDVVFDSTGRNDPPAAIVPLTLGNVSPNAGSGGINNRFTMPTAFRFNTGEESPAPDVTPFPPPPAEWVSPDTAACRNWPEANTNLDCFANAHVMGNDRVNSVWVDRDGNRIVPEQKLDTGGTAFVLTWEFDFGTLTATLSARDMDASFANDNDFTPFTIFHNLNEEFSQEQTSQEIQLTGEAGDSLSWAAGIYLFEETGLQRIALVAPLLPPAGAPPNARFLPYLHTLNRNIDNSSTALYGQVNYAFSEQLRLTVGTRATDNEKNIALDVARGDPVMPWFAVAQPDTASVSETNLLLNLAGDLSDTLMLYGQYADGFRDGGWPVRFPGLPAGIPPLDTVRFDPETVDSIEFGLKSTLWNGKGRLNAAFFLSTYSNMLISFSDPNLNGAPNTSNLGEATITGFEVELNALANDNLRFDVSLGYLNASLDSIIGGSLATGSDNLAGTITTSNALPYTPELQLGLGVNYGISVASGGHINIRGDLIHTGEQFYTIENSPRNAQDAYSILNAKASYVTSDGYWEFGGGVRNLADEEYATISGTQSDSASSYANVARPRELYLQVVYRFSN